MMKRWGTEANCPRKGELRAILPAVEEVCVRPTPVNPQENRLQNGLPGVDEQWWVVRVLLDAWSCAAG